MKNNLANDRLYSTLCEVLDSLRYEAQPHDAVYRPAKGNEDALVQARSRALLHLFLKARFGLTEFEARKRFITDGPFDGGVDAYFIDQRQRTIHILQSKFRATSGNFASSNMSAEDVLRMDIGRILRGEKKDERGHSYNSQIFSFQKAIAKLADGGSYKKKVTLLGNLRDLSGSQVRRLVGDYETEQLAHDKIYTELMFPVITGTYYTEPNLTIELDLGNVRKGSHLSYNADTAHQKTNIQLMFVPTREIGRVLSTYRNSILEFNPRSFLELDRNSVNKEIEASIRKKKTNEFAIFNNGITIIADKTLVSDDTGLRNRALVSIVNPQLVNGAQTAFTLSRIYDECVKTGNFAIFRGKEVLVKIITFTGAANAVNTGARLDLLGAISKATNSQTKVDDYDRRSSDAIQRELQAEMFSKHGMYYERKRGEFSDGLRDGYISAELIVNRERLVRVSLACDFGVSQARSNIKKFASEDALAERLKVRDAAKYCFGYEVLRLLEKRRRAAPRNSGDRFSTKEFGQALRYGQYAVVAVSSNYARAAGLDEEGAIEATLKQWPAFEAWAARQRPNGAYLDEDNAFGFVNYYKGSTIGADLQAYQFKFTRPRA